MSDPELLDQDSTQDSDHQAAAGESSHDESTDDGGLSEEKKPLDRALLLILAITLLGGGGLYAMYIQNSSQASSPPPDIQAAGATVTAFLSGGGKDLSAIRQTFSDTEKLVREFVQYPSAAQIGVMDLRTNPFRYAPVRIAGDVDAVAEKARRELERETAIKAVQDLHLQTVVHGTGKPACMINGVCYFENQTVDGFLIETIDPRSVIVRAGAYRFQIRMQQ
jgi:hypothetical protein